MASSKTVAFIALVVLVQCAWIQCQIIPCQNGLYGGGFGGLVNGCNDNNDLEIIWPILLLSLLNKNNGGCGCGGGCNGGCGRC